MFRDSIKTILTVLSSDRSILSRLIGRTASYDLSEANFSPAVVIKVEGGRRSFVLGPLLLSLPLPLPLLFFLSEVCNQG